MGFCLLRVAARGKPCPGLAFPVSPCGRPSRSGPLPPHPACALLCFKSVLFGHPAHNPLPAGCQRYLPQGAEGLWGSLPSTAVGATLASSIGAAPRPLLSLLVPGSWGLFPSLSLPDNLLFLCSKESSLPLTGQRPGIPIPANNVLNFLCSNHHRETEMVEIGGQHTLPREELRGDLIPRRQSCNTCKVKDDM